MLHFQGCRNYQCHTYFQNVVRVRPFGPVKSNLLMHPVSLVTRATRVRQVLVKYCSFPLQQSKEVFEEHVEIVNKRCLRRPRDVNSERRIQIMFRDIFGDLVAILQNLPANVLVVSLPIIMIKRIRMEDTIITHVQKAFQTLNLP